MNLTKYILPYPVLGIEGDFISTDKVDRTLSVQMTQKDYQFTVKYEIQNKTILSLIKKGLAKFCCEVDCVKTYYRKVYESDNNEFSFDIPRTSLVGDVSFFYSIIAVTTVEDYTNESFNPRYYENYKFNLQKGQLLAYLGQTIFKADIKYEELKAVGSLVEVHKDPSTSFMYFSFSGPKIRINLPEREYNNFYANNNSVTADILHASIVQSALISALHSFGKYSYMQWAETLKIRVKNDKKLQKFSDLENLDSDQICELVNAILDNADKRMFESLSRILSN